MATIKAVKARQIFDSRGNPTVEVSLALSPFPLVVFCLDTEKMCETKNKFTFYFRCLLENVDSFDSIVLWN